MIFQDVLFVQAVQNLYLLIVSDGLEQDSLALVYVHLGEYKLNDLYHYPIELSIQTVNKANHWFASQALLSE